MKTTRIARLNFLRVHPELRQNGDNKPIAGALVFLEPVGDSVAHNLSAGQLDNLAGICSCATGRRGWKQLQALIGVAVASAVVTLEPVKKGESYVDADGKEQQYIKDWTKTTIDSIILPEKFNKFQEAVAEDVIQGWNEVNIPSFNTDPVKENSLAGGTN